MCWYQFVSLQSVHHFFIILCLVFDGGSLLTKTVHVCIVYVEMTSFAIFFLSFCLFWCIKYLVILSQMKENGNVYYLDDFLIKLISLGNQQIILIIFVVIRHECILLFESRQRIQPRDQWGQESCL